MEILDKTVESLTQAGVAVILNNHISDAGWCCSYKDSNGLWHNKNYTSDQWVEAVAGLSERYLSNILVIGHDLRNEIRPDEVNKMKPSWNYGPKDEDWKHAATIAGNEILKRNPNQLIIVEGMISSGWLQPMKFSPIT